MWEKNGWPFVFCVRHNKEKSSRTNGFCCVGQLRCSVTHYCSTFSSTPACFSWICAPSSDLQSSSALLREKTEVEAAKGAAEGQTERLNQETEQLHQRAHELENEVAKLNQILDEAKLQESQLRDKAGRLEVSGQELTLLRILSAAKVYFWHFTI